MGLHPDVKKYIAERFPGAVSASPDEACQVLICDYMWLLFKFTPDENSTGEDLLDFVWRPIERFYEAGGETYVMCFDRPDKVPRAKAEEHARRYDRAAGGPDPLSRTACDVDSLPFPWHSALADRKTRREICVFISEGVFERFRLKKFSEGKTLFVHGAENCVRRAIGDEEARPSEEHAAAGDIGEGDLGVAYWAGRYCHKTVVARVLDSDQIPILMLRAITRRRTKKIFCWLVSPGREEATPESYAFLPPERRTVFDVSALNASLAKDGVRVFDFVFSIICQKTDFVDKTIKNLGVGPSLKLAESHFKDVIRVKASGASCDAEGMKKCIGEIVARSGKKRAAPSERLDVELRRAWWNLLYWTFGADGALPPCLAPSMAFGFDAAGFRPRETDLEVEFPRISNQNGLEHL